MAGADRLVSVACTDRLFQVHYTRPTAGDVTTRTPDERQQLPTAWPGPPRHGSFPSRIEVRGSYEALPLHQVQQRVSPQRIIAARTPDLLHRECLKEKIQ